MLNLMGLPDDMFQLFLTSDVLLGRLWTLFSALFSIALALFVALGMSGRMRWWPRLPLGYLVPTALATVAALLVSGVVLERVIDHEYGEYDAFVDRDLIFGGAGAVQLGDTPSPLGAGDRAVPRLDIVRSRGSLRVGYLPDSLPYAFRNSAGQVVGLDIELAHVLARDIGVSLELVRMAWDDVAPWLNAGRVDIVMSGLLPSPVLAQQVQYTVSYLTETAAFVVPDHRRHVFSTRDRVLKQPQLRIGYPLRGLSHEWVTQLFPNVEPVPLPGPRSYFVDESLGLDGLLYTAERGSAWTLLYPDYSVAIPDPLRERGPLSYALPFAQPAFLSYVNTWLAYEIPNRVPVLFAYWIQGEVPGDRNPRWSIRRDVLGWRD